MFSKACVPICHSIDYLSQPLWLVLIFKWVELLLWQADNCRVDFVDVSADQGIAKINTIHYMHLNNKIQVNYGPVNLRLNVSHG